MSASAEVQVMDQFRIYDYTDTFGDYRGTIRAITFCYSPNGNAEEETLFTVQIRKPGNGNGGVRTSRDVIVNPQSDLNERTNCINDLLGTPYCCIEQELAEPISVNHNRWFGLRVPGGPASLLLRHQTEVTNGEQTDINSGSVIDAPQYKPLFYFSIDSSHGNKCVMIDSNVKSCTMCFVC